ncbi:MAG TPA: hypothetical protein PJ991_11745 [Kiritimatiellia bacterium]|nr:hypothetical protein [Kiritimatiellia bacterium]
MHKKCHVLVAIASCLFPATFCAIAQLTIPGESPVISEANTVQSLEALQRALELNERDLAALQQEMSVATDDMARDDIRRRIQELRTQIEEQRRQFDGFAVDVDLTVFSPQRESKFDWQEQVGKLLEPIMAEIESATAESRVIGQLRTQIDDVRKRRDLAQKAVTNLESLLQQPASPELQARLNARLDIWKRTLEQANNEFMALDIQLQSRLAARESFLDQSTKYARNFFRTRGVNLLLGIIAFCVVFFGFRLASYLVRRARRTTCEKSFSSRLTALLFHIFSVLGGLLAMMMAFNLVGDWFLLGIIIIFLVGVGWASINTLPQQVETIKLMLNIGAVREGEVIMYEGTRYRVDALGFSARLVNPQLEGGMRQLPVKYLVGMSSRRPGEHEVWFPCKKGDWVELSDGCVGHVVSQTPGAVELIMPGGEHAVYQTPDFLALNPRNISDRFRIESSFGIDHRHQAIATTKVPEIMKKKLEAELPVVAGVDTVLAIHVHFANAGLSSLDYAIAVDLTGAAAPLAREIRFAIQRILVSACNENGWVIPFTQLTVHQGGKAGT